MSLISTEKDKACETGKKFQVPEGGKGDEGPAREGPSREGPAGEGPAREGLAREGLPPSSSSHSFSAPKARRKAKVKDSNKPKKAPR